MTLVFNMKLLLDTHVLIWALQDSPKLPIYIRDMICDENNEIYVSVISLWEISIKHKKDPENMPCSSIQIRDYCQRAGYIFLSLSVDNISTYEKFDLSSHKDPFDQILVCQSASNSMKLLTHDPKIKQYNVGFVELF